MKRDLRTLPMTALRLATLLTVFVHVPLSAAAGNEFYGSNPCPSLACSFSLAAGSSYTNPIDVDLRPFSPRYSNFGVGGNFTNNGKVVSAGLFDNNGFGVSVGGTFENRGDASVLEQTHGSNAGRIVNGGTWRINFVNDAVSLVSFDSAGPTAAGGFENLSGAQIINTSGLINRGNLNNAGLIHIAFKPPPAPPALPGPSARFISSYNPNNPVPYQVAINNLVTGDIRNEGFFINGSPADVAQGIHSSTLTNDGLLRNDNVANSDPLSGLIENYDTVINRNTVFNGFFGAVGARFNNHGSFENLDDTTPGGGRALLTNFSGATFDNNGTLLNGSASDGPGNFLPGFGSLIRNEGELINQGSIVNHANIENAGLLENNGLIDNNFRGPNQIIKTLMINDGTLRNNQTGVINSDAQIRNRSTGQILNQNLIHNEGEVFNFGLFDITSTGRLEGGGVYHQVEGKTRVNGVLSQTSVLLEGGEFGGSGIVQGSPLGAQTLPANFVQTGGTLAPGDPVTLTIDGDYFMSGGVLDIKVAGVNDLDQLVVTGLAEFTGGTIQLDFINGFAPRANDVFDFLVADTLSFVSFVDFVVKGLAPGFEFTFRPTNEGRGLALIALSDGIAASAVPLPPAFLLMAPALGMILARTRRAQLNTSLRGGVGVGLRL